MRFVLALATATTTLLAAGSGRATVILALGLEDLVGRADRIFVGRVVVNQSRWSDDRRRIVTDTTLLVEQDVRGTRGGEHVVVRQLGGVVGDIGMKVAGVATLRPGEQVLLFTERRAARHWLVGMQQGAFRVRRDTATGRAVLERNIDGLTLVRRDAEGRVQAASVAALAPAALELFLARIRSTIGTCQRRADGCRVGLAPVERRR